MYCHIEVRAGLRVLYRKGMGEYFREGARPRVPLLAKRGRTAYANVGLHAKKVNSSERRNSTRDLPLPLSKGHSTQTSRAVRNQNVR